MSLICRMDARTTRYFVDNTLLAIVKRKKNQRLHKNIDGFMRIYIL